MKHYRAEHGEPVGRSRRSRNRELLEEIVELIRTGNRPQTAAEMVGLDRATLYRWLQRAAEWEESDEVPADERAYCDFRDAVRSAQAEAEGRIGGGAHQSQRD